MTNELLSQKMVNNVWKYNARCYLPKDRNNGGARVGSSLVVVFTECGNDITIITLMDIKLV